MSNPLADKLERFARLSGEDRRALARLCAERTRQFTARADILREGDRPHAMNLILAGWACRYKQLADGARQIVALLLPGDLCDHDVFILREMDHTVAALTPVTLAEVSREAFAETVHGHRRLSCALAWDTLVTVSVQREWTVNLGQRDAYARLAHMFCELFERLATLGLVETHGEGGAYGMPLTQAELGELSGMSSVHVNRTLQDMRRENLITLRGGRLAIPDLAALRAAAQFNPNYLHLAHEGAQYDAGEHERA